MAKKITEVRKEIVTAEKNNRRAALLWNLRHALVEKQDEEEIFKRQVEEDADPFETYYSPTGAILRPPFHFANLYKIYEEGDVLAECVDAMQQNVDGFGYQLQYLGNDQDLEKDEVAKRERTVAEGFFNRINDLQSFTTIRKLMRQDYEVLGNGAFEVIRNRFGDPQMIFHIPFRRVRLARMDRKPVSLKVTIPRNGKMVTIKMRKYFRRYCQISAITGLRLKWFKEFGDPRIMDAWTGQFVDTRSDTREAASELWHFKIPFGDSPYGIPRWIQVVLDTIGRRNSQYVNWDLFQSQGIPPLAILVSGGTLTDDSLAELETVIRSMRGVEKWNRLLLLEANPETLGLEEKGSAKIEIRPLAEYRKEDQMFTRYLETTDEAIRHRYRLPPIYVGKASAYCFSEDTETLTNHGWKMLDDIDDNKDQIATINPNTGKMEFRLPVVKHVFDYKGLVVHILNRGVDVMVTPDHDMWVCLQERKRPTSIEKWKKEKAHDLPNYSRFWFQVSPFGFDYAGKDCSLKLDEKHIPSDVMLNLIGWYAADGCVGTEEKDDRIRFCVSREEKKEALSKLFVSIEDAGFQTVRYPYNREGGLEEFAIKNKILKNWLKENCGTHAKNKKLPEMINDVCGSDASIILDALIQGDGHQDEGGFIYSTTSPILADQVQILALKCAWRATKTEIRPGAWHIYLYPGQCIHTVVGENISFEMYCGRVYCFEVPGHLFVTRRNGKVAIHGNTHATSKTSKEVAEEQIFIPERSEFDEKVNAQLIPNLGITKWKFVSKGPQIVGPTEVSASMGAFSQTGAFSVNHAIRIANDAFGLEMSTFKEKWADYPFPIVMTLLQQGRLSEVQALAEEGVLPMLPGLPFKLAEQTSIEAVMKSDLLSDEEKVLYKRLREIQTMVEGIRR